MADKSDLVYVNTELGKSVTTENLNLSNNVLINMFNNYQSLASNEILLDSKYSKTEVDTMFNNLIGNAPDNLNSLKEFADALSSDSNYASNIQTQL